MQQHLKFLLVLLLIGIGSHAHGQNSGPDEPDCSAPEPSARRTKKSKEAKPTPRISVGVINGRARNLVRPPYPRSATDFGISGMVSISVLINERGCVEEATVLRGHPMLVSAALRAARASSFFPIHLSDVPVRVTGVIVYSFKRDRMNWLEIGFWSDEYRTYTADLPAGLGCERPLIEHKEAAHTEQNDPLTAAVGPIQTNLEYDQKSHTLFAIGCSLKELSVRSFDPVKRSETLKELRTLLDNAPANIAPKLVEYLRELIEADESELLDRTLFLSYRFYELGK